MTELELALLDMMCKPDPVYETDGISIPQQTELQGQYLIYERLFSTISQLLSSSGIVRGDDFLNKVKNDIQNYYNQKKYKAIKSIGADGKTSTVVKSSFPVISQDDINVILLLLTNAKDNGDLGTITTFRALLIYAFRSEVIARGGTIPEHLPSFSGETFGFYDVKYQAIREVYLESGNAKGHMSLTTVSFRQELIDANSKFDQFTEEFKKKTDALNNEYLKALEIQMDHERKFDEFLAYADTQKIDFESLKEETNSRIINYEKSVDEYLKTNILGNFWKERAWWASISLGVSIAIIILMLVGAGIGVFSFATEIKKLITLGDLTLFERFLLRENVSSTVSLQFTRAFLVAVPVILYFWILKLVIRFFMRSLMLMDDARQRNTIMQSYIQMVRDSAVDEKVLPIIMWALCRQVPGHGPDGIEPPDFSEVINAGLNFGKKGQGA